MIHTIYSNKDTTIYEYYPTINTGLDEILELTKTVVGTYVYNSRALIKFDVSSIQTLINAGKFNTSSYSASLQLYAVQNLEVPLDYDIYCYPLSQSWDMGTGKYAYSPAVTDGASWKYKTSSTSSVWSGSSMSYNVVSGGGVWNTAYTCTQSFAFSTSVNDLNLNVTPIVAAWLTGSVENNGFIIKMADAQETSTTPISIQFFSNETNTVYFPKLYIGWDDSVYVTGSLQALTFNQQVTLTLKNIKTEYFRNTIEKVRVYSRPLYPVRTFSTSSYYNVNYALPSSSYYQVEDYYSGDIIIPYSNFTKLSCDSTSNYFNFDFSSLIVNRMYRFCFKVESSDEVKYIKFNNVFKVI